MFLFISQGIERNVDINLVIQRVYLLSIKNTIIGQHVEKFQVAYTL